MNIKRKIFALILSFIMIITYMPIGDMTAFAEDEEKVFSIDRNGMSPDKVSAGNGKVVEITGTGFGTSKNEIEAYIRYDDNGRIVNIKEENIDPPGNNKISIYIPPSKGGYVGGARLVISRTDWGSDSISFQYIEDPEITGIKTNTEIKIVRDENGEIIYEDDKFKTEKNTYIEIDGKNFSSGSEDVNIDEYVKLEGNGKTYFAKVKSQRGEYIKAEKPEDFDHNKEYEVTINNKFGGSASFTQTINIAKHDITNLSSLNVNVGGNLTIYGSFPTEGTGEDTNLKVYIGEQEANIISMDENQIKITVPQIFPNDYQNVKVVNTAENTAVTLVGALLVLPKPISFTVESVTPNAGTKQGGTLVRIKGTNLNSNMQVKFGDKYATEVELDAEMTTDDVTVLKAITPPSDYIGTVDVTVINPLDNGQAILPNGYRYTEVENSLVVTSINPNWDYEIGGKIVSITGRNFQRTTENDEGTIVSDEEDVELVEVSDGEDKKTVVTFIKGNNEPFTYKDPNTGEEKTVVRERTLKVYFGGELAGIQLINSEEDVSLKNITIIDPKYGTQTIRVKVPQITLKPREDTDVDVTVEIETQYIEKSTYGTENEKIIDQYTEKEVVPEKFTYKLVPSEPRLEVVDTEKYNNIPSIDDNITMAKGPQGSTVYIYGLDFRSGAKVYFFKEDDKPLNELLIPSNEGEVLEVIDLEGSVDDKPISRIEVKVPNINALGPVTVLVVNPDGGRTKTLAEFKEENPFVDEEEEDYEKKNKDIENRIIARQFEYISTPVIDGVSPSYGSTATETHPNMQPIVVINGKNFLVNSYIDEGLNTVVEKPVVYVVPDSIETEEILNGLNQPAYDKYKAELKEVTLEKDDKLINPDGVKEKLGTRMVVKMPVVKPENEGYRDIIVINPDGGYARYKNGFEYKKPKSNPEIFEINPDRGSVDGGEEVKIIGKDFDYNIKEILLIVTIDGEMAEVKNVERTTYNGENAQIITIITPKGTEGTKTVQVINSDGGTAEGEYTYTAINTIPIITTIAPDKGGPFTEVLIKGDDFVLPDPSSTDDDEKIGTRVFFNDDEIVTKKENGTVVSEVYIIDRQTIRVVLPDDLPLGMKDVKVLNPDTAFFIVEDGFEYLNPQDYPEITEISPNQGSRDGGTIVTIKGSNFKEGIDVYFGEKKGINPQVNGDGTEITVTTPSYEIDEKITDSVVVPVTVVNYDGGSDTVRDGFTFRVPGSFPKIKNIDPNTGSTAGNESITIEGEDFRYVDLNENNKWDEGEPTSRVYFNGVEALSVRYVSDVEIIVITPPYLEGGRVDVVLVNPDAGTAVAKGGFTYEKSRPKIDTITPDTIPKLGGEEITILGADFMKGIEGEAEGDIDIEVIFGDEYDSDSISGGYAITNIGKLQVEYDNTDPNARYNVFVKLDGKEKASLKMNLGESRIILLSTSEETDNKEGIKIELKDKKLTVTRRLSPKVDYIDENTIIAITPPMDEVGEKTVSVVNRDGGTGKGSITVKNPNSNPIITDIDPKTPVNIKDSEILDYYMVESTIDGEITFAIFGKDFRKGVRVMIGSQEAEVLSRSNDDDMILVKSPKGKEDDVNKLLKIIVINEDGGIADSSRSNIGGEGEEKAPAYYVYRARESNPVIDSIEPNKGSIAGGDTVVIEGNDFRLEDITVRFGGKKATILFEESSYKKLVVITPPGDALGTVDVMVRNNRELGEVIAPNAFTYYSNPIITSVSPRNIHNTGGQTITVRGSMFLEGIKVYIDGVEGTDVKLIDENTLEFISPAGELGEKILRVENTDGGWDETTVTYILPIPDEPTGFRAYPGHERSIVLKWDDTPGAARYKIFGFGRKSRKGDYKFVAETTELEYIIKDLEPNTKYYFKLWAINEYGESLDYDYAYATTLKSKEDEGDDKYDQKEIKNTVIRYADGGIFIDLPTDYDGGEYSTDITDSLYKDYDKIQINIPIKAIKKGKGGVSVLARDINAYVSMYNLKASTYYRSTDDDDTNVIIMLSRISKEQKSRMIKSLSRKEKAITDAYEVKILLQRDREMEAIKVYRGINIGLTVDQDGVEEDNIYMYKFNPEENKLEEYSDTVNTAVDYSMSKFVYKIYGNIEEDSKIIGITKK